jgi:MoaA/NifB/PqqE/SkfB family radical SAM enzyme
LANKAVSRIKKNPDDSIRNLIKVSEKLVRNETHRSQLKVFRDSFEQKDNWNEMVLRFIDSVNEKTLQQLINNLIINASWLGNQKVRKNRNKYGINVPWAILIDPTSACNLRCRGCWAEDYGRTDELDFNTLNRVIKEGKRLGIYVYLFSGGEPLMRKNDLVKLASRHKNCFFLAFTNGTLVDESFAIKLAELGNFALAISMEGTLEETDARRGKGAYDKMIDAMQLLKKHHALFGYSSCYHRGNAGTIGSEKYIDRMMDLGCNFGWLFTYIPIGKNARPELIATPEQRKYMYKQVRAFRKTKPIFVMDFWNDGEYVYGCIAGGRNYFHINAHGDVEPCAFIHYSNRNIKQISLLDALRSPLFEQYRRNYPFNKNHLQPCPLLDNPHALRSMVITSGAISSQRGVPESVEVLTGKCESAAKNWEKVADELWHDNPKREYYENRRWPGKQMN